jgi:hypothetical protein
MNREASRLDSDVASRIGGRHVRACTTAGYLAIRRWDEPAHRAWMIRSYALALAAVTLRIYLPLELALGMSFGDA